MQLVEARLQLLEDLQDDSAENAVRANTWLNRSMQRIVAYNPTWSFLQEIRTITLFTGDHEFDLVGLPSIRYFHSIYRENMTEVLTAMPSMVFFDAFPDPQNQNGTPHYYTVWKKTLIFNSKHTEDVDYRCFYYIGQDVMEEDDDVPLWNPRWDYVWMLGAYYYGQLFNDDERAILTLREFDRELRKMKAHDPILTMTSVPFPAWDRVRLPGRTIYPAEIRYIL